MTITTTTLRAQYNGNGVTTSFAVPFEFLEGSTVKVILTSVAGVDTVKTLTTHYTVTGGGTVQPATGSVVMITPPATGEKLTILRAQPLTQAASYSEGDAFPAKTHEKALDRLDMQVQMLSEKTARALKLKESSGNSDLTFPEPEADKVIGWNADGDELENKTFAALDGIEVIDEDDMASNSATKVPTQQSVKAYNDAKFVATRTALKAIDTTVHTTAFVTESGRDGVFVWKSGNYTTQHAADTQEGVYVKATAIASSAGSWVRQFTGPADARWFGVVGDYSAGAGTDNLAALQVALNVADHVFLPEGSYKISDELAIPRYGTLTGAGRTRTYIVADDFNSSFNLSADSIVQLGTGEGDQKIANLCIMCVQDLTETVRADVIQYPWAIDATAAARATIDEVRIQAAWNGINCNGNAGGINIGFVECSAFNSGIEVDGPLDFFHLDTFHFWPFGIAGQAIDTSVFRDGSTYAVKVGRCDNFDCGAITSYQGIVQFAVELHQAGDATNIARQVSRLAMDGSMARLFILGSTTQIGAMYTNFTTAAATPQIAVSGGVCVIDSLFSDGEFSVITVPVISVSGTGILDVNGGRCVMTNSTSRFASMSAGEMNISGMTFDVPATNRTVSLIQQATAGIIRVRDCNFPPSAAATGNALAVGVDHASNVVEGNSFGDWDFVLVPAAPNLGLYGPNKDTRRTYATTLTASTGTITTVNTGSTTMTYSIMGDLCHVDGVFAITTNGTGASALRMTLPFNPAAIAYGSGQITGGGTGALLVTADSPDGSLTITKTDLTYPGGDGFGGRFSITFRIR